VSGIDAVAGGDGGCLALSWPGVAAVAGRDSGCLALSWAGFLFGAFFWVIERAPKFWKYKLQVVDSCVG